MRLHTHRVSVMAAALAVSVLGLSAQAQLLMNPIGEAGTGKMEVSGGLSLFKADYEVEEMGISGSGSIERQVAYGGLAYGINDKVDLTVGGGFSLKSELEDLGDDGTGYILAAGARANVWEKDAGSVHCYGQLSYIDEDYGGYSEEEYDYSYYGGYSTYSTSIDVSGSLVELLGGVLYVYSATGFDVYGGLELTPISEGDVDADATISDGYESESETVSMDLSRDDLINLRLGAQAAVGSAFIQGDVTLVGEETIRLALVKAL